MTAPNPTGGIQAAWLGLAPNTRGVIWILLYTAAFASADTLAKAMGLEMNLLVLLFLRYLFGLCLIVPVVLHLGVASIATRRPGVHATRATISVAAQLLVYYALVNMYVADVTAIGFTRPLFVTMLAVLVLAESVGWRRWGATAIGFAGVVVMVRPGSAGFDLAAGAALLGTLMFGVAMIMVRRFAPTEPPIRFIFYYHLVGAVLLLGPALYFWRTPTTAQFMVILAVAATSTVAQTFGIRAYSVGEASIVGPIEYLRLLFAAAFAYAVFAEVPASTTWLGAAIIVASTLYISRIEARRGSRTDAASP